MGKTLLEMKEITMEFPGVKALDKVSIKLHESEILALLGENGAGKSTLMKVLAGVYQPSDGQIFINGVPVKIESPKHSQNLGISIIYQEFNLISYMSIAENIFIGREPRKIKGVLNRKKINEETRRLLDRVGLKHLSPDSLISELSVAEQQLVEIAKALSFDSKIIIMDEPTAALNDEDTNKLLNIMGDLKQQGIGIIFITHRLEEVEAVADRISVLRDGQYIGSALVKNVTRDDMITMMVGRELTDLFPEKVDATDEVALEVKNLNVPGTLYDINFTVHKGEIVGIAGLMGSGKTELSRALFGLYKNMKGTVKVYEKIVRTPREAIDAGIALVTDDRKQEGLVLGLSVYENLLLPAYRKISKFGILQKRKKDEIVNRWIKDLKIKVHDPKVEVKTLSGGNQQKVVLGKWLQMNPKVLILNEPTRGIDIGAKAEIYQIMKRFTEYGIAIILISSEMPELLGMSHRILVMNEGRITAELKDVEATQEKIFYYASGGGVNV
ncbi:sugar ABC transporter ATP-binding protein [Saccharococcus caldoxylosilyticus]|uniref:sugar ABC transporter ATP-binding protein n=1 Tax=Saccharococcus caldoxylosilyticus TaxID=81408 RepID=UPI001FCBBF4D|nr:sugar ABC transporter ATP-binding protein [Parageobacillus caldoxylosilyticus]BDG36361.1 ribose import ATP-binding protein RbsA [Parageobacillus caldoxylosilyticus]BDG40148.1 ribose import ATP-binding protein RbsA [Parageobacillus caldoxylosilyticus]BDG43874.1 ribose import ATP-binding protein RbsA [Parageobacillus caldoxylosilyticus]